MQVEMKLPKTSVETDLKYKKKLSKREKISLWISRFVIWGILAVVLFPILAVVFASLSKGSSFTQTTILPESWTFDNYLKVFEKTNFLVWLKNSIIVSVAAALFQLLLVIPAAFAFSKLRFAFRSKGLMMLLILQMFPTSMALPAILRFAYNNNGMDNLGFVVILLCTGVAYNIWLMKGYMDSIPTALVEAAYVDGASTFQVLVKIIAPLIKNMALVIFLYAFIAAYSEFIISSALLKDSGSLTLSVGLQRFIKDQFSANWTQYSAAAIMASLPVVALFLSLQKFISDGFTSGSVKG